MYTVEIEYRRPDYQLSDSYLSASDFLTEEEYDITLTEPECALVERFWKERWVHAYTLRLRAAIVAWAVAKWGRDYAIVLEAGECDVDCDDAVVVRDAQGNEVGRLPVEERAAEIYRPAQLSTEEMRQMAVDARAEVIGRRRAAA